MSKATNIAGRLIALIKMNAMAGTFAKASYEEVLAVLEPFVQELKNLQLEDERQKARFEEALSYEQMVYELQNCLRQFCAAVRNGVQSEDQRGKVYTQQFGQAMLQYGMQLLDKKPSKKWQEKPELSAADQYLFDSADAMVGPPDINEARRKFGEQYAYKSIEEYEAIVGYRMSEAFKTGFMMGRLKNKNLGIFPEDG